MSSIILYHLNTDTQSQHNGATLAVVVLPRKIHSYFHPPHSQNAVQIIRASMEKCSYTARFYDAMVSEIRDFKPVTNSIDSNLIMYGAESTHTDDDYDDGGGYGSNHLIAKR